MIRRSTLAAGLLTAVLAMSNLGFASAATTPAPPTTPPGNFNLQVSPSPLVTTVKPGVKTELELKIRNAGTGTEELQIAPRTFSFNSGTGKVNLSDTTPPPIASWISFSAAKFTVLSGQTFSESITLNPPKDAGFSYSFALVITRQNNPKPQDGTREINGSVAIFTLINVDRPGATSGLKINLFSTSKKFYEYLPATFSIRFKNTGNTIVQPLGSLFIQRGANDHKPLATLSVNSTQGYILPGTERTVTASWGDGFPSYHTVTNADGSTSQKLVWSGGQLSKIRFGRYTASLVAVYSQAGRDVPIEGTVTFWVFPWKLLLAFILGLVIMWGLPIFIIYKLMKRRDKSGKSEKNEKPSKTK